MKPPSGPVTRTLLYLPAQFYQAGVRLRSALYQQRILHTHQLPAPVISVGNLTVGGTGKTPLTAFIAQYLHAAGFSPAILSRGYKRASTGRLEVSDGQRLCANAQSAGDEPYLLAQACPGVRVVVDQNRYAAGRWLAQKADVSVFILDDGYQHLRLARDLNLLLLDASEPITQLQMLPFGRLREPLSAMQRADALILTRADELQDRAAYRGLVRCYARAGTPVFHASHHLTRLRRLDADETVLPTAFSGRTVAAVSGIARPDRFIADLRCAGMSIALRRDFRDHHRYSEQELTEIIRQTAATGATAIIMTEKDAANLPEQLVPSSALPLYAAQIEFRCEEESELKNLIRQRIKRKNREKAATN